jgi:hypothetical protein
MQISKLIPAALAALTITGFAAVASAAPGNDGDYVTRAVPASSNPHEVFMRLVKVPKTRAVADNGDRAMMTDHAAMRAMCERMMREHHDATQAPKG